MILNKTIDEVIEQLEEINWGLVQNDKKFIRMYKLSEETSMEGLCQITKKKNFYNIYLTIRDPFGKNIYYIKKIGDTKTETGAARWFERFAAMEGEAFLSRETNEPEIKNIYDKYKKLKNSK